MRGEISIFVSAILMGLLPLFVKIIASVVENSLTIAFIRHFFGLIFISVILLFTSQKPRFSKELFMLGVVNTTVISLYIASISLLYAATAAFLLYMAPIYVAIYLFLIKRNIDKSFIAIPIGIFGLLLMLSPYGELNIGLIYGFFSGIVYAIFFIFIKRLRQEYSSLNITFSNLLVGTILLSPFAFEIGSFDPIFILLGLIPTAIPFTLLSYGMKFVREDRATVIALVEPLTASIIGFMVFGEFLSFKQIIGGFMILIGVVMAMLYEH